MQISEKNIKRSWRSQSLLLSDIVAEPAQESDLGLNRTYYSHMLHLGLRTWAGMLPL